MSNRKLAILAVVAVLMMVWAVLQSRISNRPRTEPGAPSYLIQGLDPADVGSIVLGAGQDTVTLKRRGKGFVVVDKDNYPADTKQVNALLTASLDIRTGQLYTDNAANHSDLGVTEENARDVVRFLKPDSSLLVGFVLGQDRELGQGTYVRLLSSNKVYIAQGVPRIREQAMEYINRDLISLQREDIDSVTVGSSIAEYTLNAKQDGRGLVLENTPVGKKLKDSDSQSVFTALTSLGFDDVKKESAQSEQLTFDRQFVCVLKDSTVYTLKIASKDDQTYVTCQARFTDTEPVTKERDVVESEEELKKKEAVLITRGKAMEFTARHKGWIYKIPQGKADALTKELSDLLEDEPASEEIGQTPEPAKP